jgi:hypothetical protein
MIFAGKIAGKCRRPRHIVARQAILHLVGKGEERHLDSRGHFFAAAAEAMRRILIDNARRKLSGKHCGGLVNREADPDDARPNSPYVADKLEVRSLTGRCWPCILTGFQMSIRLDS